MNINPGCEAGRLWGRSLAEAGRLHCAGGLWGVLASLVLCWGAVGSPGFTGTVLGAVGSPGFPGTVLGTVLGLWGSLALLVLCWGAAGSPGFAGAVLGGLWGALASLVLCWGLLGALALLVLCWGAVGSPGFAGAVLGGCGEPWLHWCWALGKSFLSVPNVANTVFQCRFIRNTFLHVPFKIMMISKVLNVV